MTAAGELGAMGVLVFGGRIEQIEPWNTAGLTNPLWPLVSRPAVTSLVSGLCGPDGSSFEELRRIRHPRRYAAAAT
jgi:hypothetical protein